MSIDIEALRAALKGLPKIGAVTAELEDDNAPDGAVILRDADGNVVAVMSRASWDSWALWTSQ